MNWGDGLLKNEPTLVYGTKEMGSVWQIWVVINYIVWQKQLSDKWILHIYEKMKSPLKGRVMDKKINKCGECEFFDHDEILSQKHLEYVAYCEKTRIRVWPDEKSCENFKLLNTPQYKDIKLDIGCGPTKPEGFVGLDKKEGPGVDIVHDLEVFPYPLPDDCCLEIRGSHIIEHIKPWLTINFMNELWRIMILGGQLTLTTPIAGSNEYWQDPTHCNGCVPKTFEYFDPRYSLYMVYEPKPWQIEQGFPIYKTYSTIKVMLGKIKLD